MFDESFILSSRSRDLNASSVLSIVIDFCANRFYDSPFKYCLVDNLIGRPKYPEGMGCLLLDSINLRSTQCSQCNFDSDLTYLFSQLFQVKLNVSIKKSLLEWNIHIRRELNWNLSKELRTYLCRKNTKILCTSACDVLIFYWNCKTTSCNHAMNLNF